MKITLQTKESNKGQVVMATKGKTTCLKFIIIMVTGWMILSFMSRLTVFQSYSDDGLMTMKGY